MSKTKPHAIVVVAIRLAKNVWLFPTICAVIFFILTSLQISGSSVGEYHTPLYGNTKDPSLLINKPQSIRSDEWLVTTGMTIAQRAAGYPRVNPNIHGGTDMSIIGDAPYKDWSEIFKPQNLVFFVLPLAYAFAFKWWLLLLLVIVSAYFVVLRFFPGRRLLAALISSAVGLNPFLFWWYQTSALAPVFYGLFILLVSMRIINGEKIPILKKYPGSYSQFVYILTLGYLLIAFALIEYPPFQIPIALAVFAFLAGYFLEKYGTRQKILSGTSLRKVSVFAASALLAGTVVFAFIHTRNVAVQTVEHTVYPGMRKVEGGGSAVVNLFSSYLQPQLEHERFAIHYYTNQSEAASFLLFLPFLLPPGFILIYLEYRQKRELNWSLLALQICTLLFLANLYTPALQPIYSLFRLDKVPHARLFIGLGFLGILQLLCIMKSLASLEIPRNTLNWLAGGYTILCLAVLAWVGQRISSLYPTFIHSPLLIGFFAVLFASIIFCFLSGRFMWGAVLLLIFHVGCVFHIQPLYRGLGFLSSNQVFQAIDRVSKPGDTWVTLDAIYFENFASMSNRDSLSGVQLYPNLAFWRQVEGPKADIIYNRFAHVQFIADPPLAQPLYLAAPDRFQVQFACTPFIEKNVKFALSTNPVVTSCTRLIDEVHYPKLTFYLYRIH